MIRLIVTADDVGLHPTFTAGALEARRHGIVTSLSVVTASRWWPQTLEALQGEGVDEIGVHLTVCEGEPVGPPDALGGLVVDGRFGRSLAQAAALTALHRGSVRTEWTAQVRRAQDAGFTVTHLDGHKHLHVLPGLAGVVSDVAQATGVRGIRRPVDVGAGPRKRVRGALALSSSLALRGETHRSPDRCVGIADSGGMDTPKLLSVLRALRPGVTELVCHPASASAGYPHAPMAEGLSWTADYAAEAERQALLSAAAREASEHLELLSWGEFVAAD